MTDEKKSEPKSVGLDISFWSFVFVMLASFAICALPIIVLAMIS